ncbi:spermatogenesis-associated protein 20 [Gaertneriomyces sp. JEL0708]|nr:spermatogenesis-associated protein 20 [Gaertneriomyces sp. JEL0708]
MEHESFENEEIAKIMNENFVKYGLLLQFDHAQVRINPYYLALKEERPNVDRVYMTFVQATTGGGGWPMSVFLTPDLTPIYGGTYFPPSDKWGQPGFPTVLHKLAKMWTDDKPGMSRSGEKIVELLQNATQSKRPTGASGELTWKVPAKAYEHYTDAYDSVLGGFGGAPKFPTPVQFDFLFRYYAMMRVPQHIYDELPSYSTGQLRAIASRYGLDLRIGSGVVEKSDLLGEVLKGLKTSDESAENALEMVTATLKHIARGGIHDHVGNGFHRYSVDKYWHVPHFEKMLYDQAQLLAAYCEAFAVTRDDYYAEIAADIITYVQRDLRSPDGGFYCAEDADSYPKHGDQKKLEGAFAVWTYEELEELLPGDMGKVFGYHFGVEQKGNVNPRNDPHGELKHQNVLLEKHTPDETARQFNMETEQVQQVLSDAKKKLAEVRKQRPPPHLDDKVITSWNGLMISALARAYQILVVGGSSAGGVDKTVLDLAVQAASFFQHSMYDTSRKVLKRSFREGPGAVEGFADDYAFLIQGLLDLYEATFDESYLRWAAELQETQDALFWDDVGGGYFSGSATDKNIILRMKEDHDGAEPAASSVSANNLLRLEALVPKPSGTEEAKTYRGKAQRVLEAFAHQIASHPYSMPQMVVALMTHLRGAKEIILHGDLSAPASTATHLLRTIQSEFVPNRTLALARPDASATESFIAERNEAFKSILQKPIEAGAAEVFVCKGFECGLPVKEEAAVKKLLIE